MPLSEHEQKLLEQMERALYAEDPKFASSMKGQRRAGPPKKRVVAGLCVAVLGLACVVAGVGLELIWLGGLGFAVMVAGVAWASGVGSGGADGATLTDTSTGRTRHTGRARRTRGAADDRQGRFMQRMENRWDERRRGGAY
ncbi:DUF3040 domain-containing protein [Mobilicoccus pelagius]|uniref:DUF3040 domain-containing protein n=1 Tax=Mobilicoccus pelagius NBRC 104925 TaxID=1089455 RepID=H5UUR1_9MICO|nr:DUF3040 domain-containing protein [Mobilicoccus pelagius]GAB49469.1 hypothetical protein MOPEL_130_00760 [Mobilicoccus pelagius NBRC 104925]